MKVIPEDVRIIPGNVITGHSTNMASHPKDNFFIYIVEVR
jgi:hypothetical protein